jgi:hypothetical protein
MSFAVIVSRRACTRCCMRRIESTRTGGIVSAPAMAP